MVLFPCILIAQVGVYKTYEDYKKNKLYEYSEYLNTYHAFGDFKVVFLDKNGEKVRIDIKEKEMWGYVNTKGYLFRIDRKNNPNVVMINGKIVVYGNYSTILGEESATMKGNQFAPKFSFGLDGEMFDLKKSNLKKELAWDRVALQKLKQTSRYPQALIDFIMEYNEANSE